MLNKNDKKNIIVVILVVILVLGILAIIHGLQKVNQLEQEKYPIPQSTPTNPQVEENQGQSEDSSNSYSIPVYQKTESKKQSSSKKEEPKEEVVPKYPKVTIPSNYYIASFQEAFTLPEISSLEDSNDQLIVTITYMFQALDSIEFVPVLEFSTEKLGVYQITYHVENQYHYVTNLEFYVEVVDNNKPIIEGIIERKNEDQMIEYIPVESGSFIHETVTFSFRDDDEISYLEYYNASIDNSISGDTVEEFATPTVIPIEIGSLLTLTEEGEYHIRAYDRSGNVAEFVITLDFTNPQVEVTYQQVGEDLTLVTIVSNEPLQEVKDFEKLEDQTTVTKIYQGKIEETLPICDLAGNEILVELNYQPIVVEVMQNNLVTQSRNLNQNDGEIKLNVIGTKTYMITYTVDNSERMDYTNQTVLTEDGFYQFYITDGDYETKIELSISSMGISD